MAQPTAYVRVYDFDAYQASNPADPLPSDKVEAEFDAIKLTTDEVRANLALIQRDDGNLANGSVTPESLSTSTAALIATGGTPQGAWVTATVYAVGGVVTKDNATYLCAIAHTAGTFSTDLAAGKWILIAAAISPFAQTILDDTSAGAVLTTLGVSAFAQTILDDTTAGAALTTLGVSAFAQTVLDDTTAAAARATLLVPHQDASGRVIVREDGSTTAVSDGIHSTSPQQQSAGSGSKPVFAALKFEASSSDTRHGFLSAFSRHATIGSHTIVQNGDALGALSFAGSDGTAFLRAAGIHGVVDGAPGTNDMPGALQYYTTADGASSATYRGRMDSAGRFVWGYTAPISTAGASNSGLVHVVGDAANEAVVTVAEFNASPSGIGPGIAFARSRNATAGSHTIMQDGDSLGSITWHGSDGSTFVYGAQIAASVAGTPGTNDMPTKVYVSVNADGSATPTSILEVIHGIVQPGADDAYDLGQSSNRWDDVYATNGTIQTSDPSQKRNIRPAVLGLDFLLAADVITFKWKNVDLPEIVEQVTETRQKTYKLRKTVVDEKVEVIDGKAVLVKTERVVEEDRIAGEWMPLHTPEGDPIEDIVEVEGPGGQKVQVKTPRMYFVPEHETVTIDKVVQPARAKTHSRDHIGFDARQIKQILKDLDIDVGLLTQDADSGLLGVRPGEMLAVVAQAVKELAARVAVLEQGGSP